MLTFDGLGAVTRRSIFPCSIRPSEALSRTIWRTATTPRPSGPPPMSGITCPEMPQHVKQVAINYCTTAALKAEGVTEITAEDMYQFQDERNATLSQAAKDLDPQLFYEAILNS